MPRQMKGGSFTIRPGRQAQIGRQVTVNTDAVRFKPRNPKPVEQMHGSESMMSESQEERVQQSA